MLAQLLVGPLLPLAPAVHLAAYPVSDIYTTKLDHPPTLEVSGTPKTPDNSFEVTKLENSLSSHGHSSNQNLVSSPDITVTGIPTHVSSSAVDSQVTDSLSPGIRFGAISSEWYRLKKKVVFLSFAFIQL